MSGIKSSSSGQNWTLPLALGVGAAAAVGVYLFLKYAQSGTNELPETDKRESCMGGRKITQIPSTPTQETKVAQVLLNPDQDIETGKGGELEIKESNNHILEKSQSKTTQPPSTRDRIIPEKWGDAEVNRYVEDYKDYQDNDGNEFLHIAARDIKDPKFFTAVINKYVEVVGEALQKRLEHKNNAGKTPYQIAYHSQRGDQQINYLRALRSIGASPQI